MREVEPTAADGRELAGAVDDRRIRLVAGRMGQPHLHAERRAEQGQRVIDIVPVADERQDEPIEPPKPLTEREDIGQGLARVLAQGQAVDDRNRGLGRELDDHGVRSRPGNDGVDEPLEIPGDVADALAGTHDDVLGQVDRVPAELVHARLERDASAKARALEEHRDRPPDKRRRSVAAAREEFRLELRGAIEDPNDLIASEVGHRE